MLKCQHNEEIELKTKLGLPIFAHKSTGDYCDLFSSFNTRVDTLDTLTLQNSNDFDYELCDNKRVIEKWVKLLDSRVNSDSLIRLGHNIDKLIECEYLVYILFNLTKQLGWGLLKNLEHRKFNYPSYDYKNRCYKLAKESKYSMPSVESKKKENER